MEPNRIDKSGKEELMENIKLWHMKLCKNKYACARLRRCESPEKVMIHKEMYDLLNIMPKYISPEAVATIAGILAHVNLCGEGKLGEKLGSKKNGQVIFSESRFKKLLSCKEWNEFYTALRRAILILNRNVELLSVVEAIILWDEDKKGKLKEPSKKLFFKLANEYYYDFK